MTEPELKVVYKHIHNLVGSRHGCAMRADEISFEEWMRGVRIGDLCDDCKETVKALVKDIQTETEDLAKKT